MRLWVCLLILRVLQQQQPTLEVQWLALLAHAFLAGAESAEILSCLWDNLQRA